MKKYDQSLFGNEISKVEEIFLELGAHRMSEFFCVKNFKNHISSEHILWFQGNDGYYHIRAAREHRKPQIIVQYSAEMDRGFEDYSQFEYPEDENSLSVIINGILHGVLPKEEKTLNKYIDIGDETFVPDVTEITKKYPIDNNISITLKVYLDPKKQDEILAEYAWGSYEEKKESILEGDTAPLHDLIEAFFGYWRAEDYEKTISVSQEFKNAIKAYFSRNDELNELADLFIFISLYLTEDYVSARNLGERIKDDYEYSEKTNYIKIEILEFLSSTYFALGQRDKAIGAAKEYYLLCLATYGSQNNGTIRAKLKYNLFRGIDTEPKKTIEEAEAIYRFFLNTEGKHGENTASALSNLSTLLSSFGAYNQALMADGLLYKIYEQEYGKDDTRTLYSLQDMAVDISHVDIHSPDAETLAKYAFNRAALKYGNKSLEAAIALSTCAEVAERRGAYGRALLALEKRLEIIEELYGSAHPRTMGVKEEVAGIYRTESEGFENPLYSEKALKLDKEVCAWKEGLFGENDKSTIETEEMINYDLLLMERKEEALEQQTELIDRCEIIFGTEDLFSVKRYFLSCHILSKMKRYNDALALDQYVLKMLRTFYSEEHPFILQFIDNIIHDLIGLKQFEKAADLARKGITQRVDLLGEYHEETQKLIELYSDIKQELKLVVHYFNYHVPNGMGFELLREEEGYFIYYSEINNGHQEDKNPVYVPDGDVAELIEILKPAATWKEKYEGEKSFYGYGFELRIKYKDLQVDSTGDYAFPDNYEKIHKNISYWIKLVL